MEKVLTRDSDIIREYLATLDSRDSGLFARIATAVKLRRLRRELDSGTLETTEDDAAALRREVEMRLSNSMLRRLQSKPWGARLSLVLLLILAQQLILALVWLASSTFSSLAPVPQWWSPALPRDEPGFLYLFIFLFFFITPMLALAAYLGGRFFRAWRISLPATVLIFAVAAAGTYLTLRGKDNPLPGRSLAQFAKQRGASVENFNEWVSATWLLNDERFRRDYDQFLRNGPGRWITSRLDSDDSWSRGLDVMGEYLDGGQDPDSFTDWLEYYFERNRIFSEDRIDSEVDSLTGSANQPYLGIWQVEPYLKERDVRLYQSYLTAVNRSMLLWGLVALGLFTVAFVVAYATAPLAARLRRLRTKATKSVTPDSPYADTSYSHVEAPQLGRSYYPFPEAEDITSPPFFQTPFQMLSNAHRSYVRLAVFGSIAVFVFWALVWGVQLASASSRPSSLSGLIRAHLLLPGGSGRSVVAEAERPAALQQGQEVNLVPSVEATALLNRPLTASEAAMLARIRELERLLDETEWGSNKRFKEQERTLTSQRAELDLLSSLSSQLQQTTSGLPEQVADATSRANAAEARVSGVLSDLTTTQQKAENLEKQLDQRLGEFESRVSRASDQAGKIEDQVSVITTRTEALERELDRRARQVEARTEELGERTAALKEREERLTGLQRAAFQAILTDLRSDVDELDRRTRSVLFRMFSKGEGQQRVESLRQRIGGLKTELGEMNTDQARQLIEELDQIGKRVDEIADRVK